MKKILGRSSKSSTKPAEARHPQNSVPPKSLIAIQPPKKVIQALYDYEPQNAGNNPGFLSFSQGDFLHVVGREDDPDWYEACNPLYDTRGLVPVNFFKEIGKQSGKKSPTLGQSGSRSSAGQHDSGFAEKDSQRGSVNGPGSDGDGHARRNNVGMIYGMVLYDFKAERPDELEARAGENIVVIAQSTPEWFVAKPITRLGGPGLIPVGFVEIRDTTTGRAVENTQEAIARAGIPRVEEWKQMAANYKASSIPLGRLDVHNQSLNSSMERLSVNSKSRGGGVDFDHNGQEVRHSAYGSSSDLSSSEPQRFSQMISPVRARIAGYVRHNDEYYFTVEAVMEDGRLWNLGRTYKDFYALQRILMEQFPQAAGNVKPYPRTLPYMPGPVPTVTEALTSNRRELLDDYIRQLLRIDPNITNSQAVRMFFYPRDHDQQQQPQQPQGDDDGSGYRLSGASQNSSSTATAGATPRSAHSSTGALSINGYTKGGHARARREPPPPANNSPLYTKQPPPPTAHYRADSDLRPQRSGNLDAPPSLLRNNSALTLESTTDSPRTSGGGGTTSAVAASPIKIKVWFGEANCVVIRLPPRFNLADLVAKLRDRWCLERPEVGPAEAEGVVFRIEYRDEVGKGFYGIEGDEDLEVARGRNEKLTLRVRAVEDGEGDEEEEEEE